MSVITDSTTQKIDSSKIKKGDFIRAKYQKWDDYHNGLVAKVKDTEIRVLYIPTIGNITNYFTIYADEITAGAWELSWSEDLATVENETDGEDTEGTEDEDTGETAEETTEGE